MPSSDSLEGWKMASGHSCAMLSLRYSVLQLGTNTAVASSHVRLLGVDISSDLSLDHHVYRICAGCYYRLHQLWRLRCGRWTPIRWLHYSSMPLWIQGLITATLFASAPRTVTDKLQHVLNAAALVVTGTWNAAWVRYCMMNFTGSTSPTGCFLSWQWLFTDVWTAAHHRTYRTTASQSPVLTLGAICLPPTVNY